MPNTSKCARMDVKNARPKRVFTALTLVCWVRSNLQYQLFFWKCHLVDTRPVIFLGVAGYESFGIYTAVNTT
jgi:hypothetical protein